MRLAAGFAAAMCGLVATLFAAAPASAHAVLVRSSPAQGAIVAAPPTTVVLTFSERITSVPKRIQVIAPDGVRWDTGKPVVQGQVLTIPLRPGGPRGTYLVSYRIISADNHPLGGGFTFSVGAPSAVPASLPAESPSDPVVRTVLAAAGYVGYAGLTIVAGAALALIALWPRRLPRRRPTRLAWLGLGLVVLGAVVELVAQAPYQAGTSFAGITAASLRDVLGSWYGTLHLLRLAVTGAAVFLLRPVLAGRGSVADHALLAVLALVGLATWPLAGHPSASPMPPVTVLADAAHLAGMAIWIGGLAMLFGFLLRQANETELAAILPVWARWAALAVGAVLFTGSVQALVEVGTLNALVNTSYGRLVIVKVALFAAVVAVAWFSRRLVLNRVAVSSPGRLRRYVAMELGVLVVVMALAATLVQQTPARVAQANPTEPTFGPYSATLNSRLYSLQVDIDPARIGNNSVHLYAYTPAGQPQRVVEWRATAALPSAGIDSVTLSLLPITDNHAVGTITLPDAGDWEFRFTLRLSDVDQATVTANVSIK